MNQNVFLSVGTPFTQQQEDFVKEFELYLNSNSLTPQTAGRSIIQNKSTLEVITGCMNECHGVVILAFERIKIKQGSEKNGSPDQVDLNDVNLTTPWNHAEAAIAYSLGLPILMLVEKGIKYEGLIDEKFHWQVKKFNLNGSVLMEPNFIQLFSNWKNSLKKDVGKVVSTEVESKTPDVDVTKLTLGQIFSAIKPAQLWGIGTALFALLTAVAVTAFNFGKMLSK